MVHLVGFDERQIVFFIFPLISQVHENYTGTIYSTRRFMLPLQIFIYLYKNARLNFSPEEEINTCNKKLINSVDKIFILIVTHFR